MMVLMGSIFYMSDKKSVRNYMRNHRDTRSDVEFGQP